MQINIALAKDNEQQAEELRRAWYPGTTRKQTRDAFIFNTALDRFQKNPEVLIPIIESEENGMVVQRMLTIKAESNERLKDISTSIDKPLAATYRAIIRCAVENLDVANSLGNKNAELADVSQIIVEKLAKLERQLNECNKTRLEIQELLDKMV